MKRKRAPNLNTFNKIQALSAYRDQYMREHGKPPLITHACETIGIMPRTVKRNAPDLVLFWKNMNFHL